MIDPLEDYTLRLNTNANDFDQIVQDMKNTIKSQHEQLARLRSEWSVMARACGNWRSYGDPTDDHDHPDWKIAAAAIIERDLRNKQESHNETRKVFICVHCEGMYADFPVSQCDCMEGTGHDFVESVVKYNLPPVGENEDGLRLSKKLERDNASGDFGSALQGYAYGRCDYCHG